MSICRECGADGHYLDCALHDDEVKPDHGISPAQLREAIKEVLAGPNGHLSRCRQCNAVLVASLDGELCDLCTEGLARLEAMNLGSSLAQMLSSLVKRIEQLEAQQSMWRGNKRPPAEDV